MQRLGSLSLGFVLLTLSARLFMLGGASDCLNCAWFDRLLIRRSWAWKNKGICK
ncbi:hypothetical protein SEVIR_3G331348v4 [Setaria viridis]